MKRAGVRHAALRQQSQVKTQHLINVLVADLTVSLPVPGRAVAWALVIGAVVALLTVLPLAGIRADIAEATFSVRFLLKLVLDVLLAASAIGLTLRFARPDIAPGYWKWALAIVPLALALAVAAELIVLPVSQWRAQLLGVNWLACLALIVIFSIAPLIGLLTALKYAAPANPGRAGALAGIAAGGIGAIIYAAHCPDDSPLFVAAWYTLAIGMVSLMGYLVARRRLRW